MLAFITSVRHPQNSTSFSRVVDLLRATLKSVLAQTDSEYRVIVVANREADLGGVVASGVRLAPVDFPAPSTEKKATIGKRERGIDRGCKYAVGVREAMNLGCSHVMFFDADDFVHRGIARAVRACDETTGLYSYTGLVRSAVTGTIKPKRMFHLCNGTTHAVPTRVYDRVGRISPDWSIGQILRELGEPFVTEVLGDHVSTVEYCERQGVRMRPFGFPAATWNVETGENRSGSTSKKGLARESAFLGRRFGFTPNGSDTIPGLLGSFCYLTCAVAEMQHRLCGRRSVATAPANAGPAAAAVANS